MQKTADILPYSDFFRSIYRYREYLTQSIARDLKKRYKRTSLGYLWSMLNPLLTMVVLTVVFSNLLPRRDNYMMYLFSALIGWQYFSSAINESLDSVRTNMKIIEQVPIPKYMFTVSIATSNLVNFLLSLVALLLVALATNHPIPLTILILPIAFLPLLIYTWAFALFFAATNVFFEDVKHLSKVLLSAWYFLTPVLYGPDMLSPIKQFYFQFNPLYHPVNFLRQVIYSGVMPNWEIYSVSLAGAVICLGVSLSIFRASDDKFLYFL